MKLWLALAFLLCIPLLATAQAKLELKATLTTEDEDQDWKDLREGFYISPFFGTGPNQTELPKPAALPGFEHPRLTGGLTKGITISYTLRESPSFGLTAFERTAYVTPDQDGPYGTRLQFAAPLFGIRTSGRNNPDLHLLFMAGVGPSWQTAWISRDNFFYVFQANGACYLLRPGIEVGITKRLQVYLTGQYLGGFSSLEFDLVRSNDGLFDPDPSAISSFTKIRLFDLNLGVTIYLH